MAAELKTCDICRISSSSEQQDILVFGDWMNRGSITVHYNCLLLATNLPQNGSDGSGILGFLLKDIRKEIQEAAQRSCCYCCNQHASIRCAKCTTYFHLDCGYKNGCLFTFHDEFLSYCDLCFPLDENQQKFTKNPPKSWCCAICQGTMSIYKPYNWIYAKCCGNGWVHRVCIQKYALSAGYYLRCIWCKNQSFRASVRQQGIFVPDRDANWEREKDAYHDLHRGYSHCDKEPCLCPKGRDFKSPTSTGNWRILICILCGSCGTHFGCLRATEKVQNNEFKCSICKKVENNSAKGFEVNNAADRINHSVYMHKTKSLKDVASNSTATVESNIDSLPNRVREDVHQSLITNSKDLRQTSIHEFQMVPKQKPTNLQINPSLQNSTQNINIEISQFNENSLENSIQAIQNLNKERSVHDAIQNPDQLEQQLNENQLIDMEASSKNLQNLICQYSTQIVDVEGSQTQTGLNEKSFQNIQEVQKIYQGEDLGPADEVHSEIEISYDGQNSTQFVHVDYAKSKEQLNDEILQDRLLISNALEQYSTQLIDVENTQTQQQMETENVPTLQQEFLELQQEASSQQVGSPQASSLNPNDQLSQTIELESQGNPLHCSTQMIDIVSSESQLATQRSKEEMSHSSTTKSKEPINILNNCDRFHVFEAFKIINNDCKGSITFKIDRLDPRFYGLTIKEIENSNLLDEEKDAIDKSSDRGIFDIIDEIIASGVINDL